ncbi:hypothetical protein [uncultured Nostoc sp.]|uniref:hypothetical protein n=1 Tax=uncultured Nostoc sp. TaxID=340711 RepID=UPI0035CA8E8E
MYLKVIEIYLQLFWKSAIVVCGAMNQKKSYILFLVGVISILTMRPAQADSDISHLQDVIHPKRSAALLAQDSSVTVVQVTEVKANPTNKGVEVILQTSVGQQLQVIGQTHLNIESQSK